MFTPVCTYASVDDNVSNSKLELLVGSPLDTDEPKTVFDWFRSIWSELLTITTTMDTVVGDVNSLEEKVVALSSKIDLQTTTLNQKIDSQASALSSKIDVQTTTLSNKISSSGGSASASRALPSGGAGEYFLLDGSRYMILRNDGSCVWCAYLGNAGSSHSGYEAKSIATNVNITPRLVLGNHYNVSDARILTEAEARSMSSDLLVTLVNTCGAFWVDSDNYKMCVTIYGGSLMICQTGTDVLSTVAVFTITRK